MDMSSSHFEEISETKKTKKLCVVGATLPEVEKSEFAPEMLLNKDAQRNHHFRVRG